MVQRTEILQAGPAAPSPPWPPWSISRFGCVFCSRRGLGWYSRGQARRLGALGVGWFCGGREGCFPKERMARQEGNMGRCRYVTGVQIGLQKRWTRGDGRSAAVFLGWCLEDWQKEGVLDYQVELATSRFEPGWTLEIDGDADNLERTGSGKPSSRHCCLLKRRHPASSPWHGAPFGFCFTTCWLDVA
jgi:hypothetical protein